MHALGSAVEHHNDGYRIGQLLRHVESKFASERVVLKRHVVPSGIWRVGGGGKAPRGSGAADKRGGEKEEAPEKDRKVKKSHDQAGAA